MKTKSPKKGIPPMSPIDLTQEEVDEMITRGPGNRSVTSRIRASRSSLPLGKLSSLTTSPAQITRKDMDIIHKKGKPGKQVLAKIAKLTLEKSRAEKSPALSMRSKKNPDRKKP